jgi:hypothetical protein
LHQQVGHLGQVQDDFNLLGHVKDPDGISSLSYRLNGAPAETLRVGSDRFGDGRRLAARGDFNADIALGRLQIGENTVVLTAVDSVGDTASRTVRVDKIEAEGYPLPAEINWSDVDHPQEVGVVVDGHWGVTETGLRTLETGYDRIFLIGNTTWQDVEVTVPVTINRVDPEVGPNSGGGPSGGKNGLGIILRFTGHAVGTYRNWPEAQPKWGFLPFGSIGWLRWPDGADNPPHIEFFRGDTVEREGFGIFPAEVGETYWMKMRAMTLPDSDEGHGVTRYTWKVWPEGESEPDIWPLDVVQTSEHALRRGGVVLLAHHVDATFGNVRISSLDGIQ